MNVTPMCEHTESFYPGQRKVTIPCESRAEWHVINKTSSLQYDYCAVHLQGNLTPGHTYSIFPARSRAKKDGLGLTLGEAKKKRVCRICGEPSNPIQRPDGTMNTFILGYGHEHAHEDCLGEEGCEDLEKRLRGKGPFRGD